MSISPGHNPATASWRAVRCCECGRLLFKASGEADSLLLETRCRGCGGLLLITRGRSVEVTVPGTR